MAHFVNQDQYWAKSVLEGKKSVENMSRGPCLGLTICHQNHTPLCDGAWKPPHACTMLVDPKPDDRTKHGGGMSHWVAWLELQEPQLRLPCLTLTLPQLLHPAPQLCSRFVVRW